jgi:hypothetical protein
MSRSKLPSLKQHISHVCALKWKVIRGGTRASIPGFSKKIIDISQPPIPKQIKKNTKKTQQQQNTKPNNKTPEKYQEQKYT